jgi:hypothetical protein
MPANVIEVTGTYREEDTHRALIFVDMLGFGELTRRNPHRISDRQAAHGSVVSSTSRLQTQLVRFQRVIDNLIASQAAHAGVSAQVFSDCAYIDVGRFSRRAVEVAPGLMRDFILADVPVRMGIGMGTYYAFRHSLEQADDQLVARSLVPASFSRTTRKRAARRDVGFSFTGRPKRACTTTNTTHP